MKDLYISNGNVKIHIHDYEQSGKAVIFLHFGGANLIMWQRALPYFQHHYRLILVDMRGHGKSDRPESGYHIDEMAAGCCNCNGLFKSRTGAYYRMFDGSRSGFESGG